MKYLFVDTETTGTDHTKHGLLQCAGVIAIDGKIVDRFDLKMRPFPEDAIEDEALKVNGLDRLTIGTWPEPARAYAQFVGLLGKYCDKFDRSDKFHMVGYNADFDAAFIRRWFEKCGDKYFGSWCWWPIIDVSKVAGIRLMRDRHLLKDFKLATVAAHLGITFDQDQLHNATVDVEVTVRMFKRLMADIPMLKMFGDAQ